MSQERWTELNAEHMQSVAKEYAEKLKRAEQALAEEQAGAAALREALQAFHPDRLDEDSETDEECQECGDHYACRDDCSASAECDICAHSILEVCRKKARAALATDAGKALLERLARLQKQAT